MKIQNVNFKRLIIFIKPEWLYVTLSLISGLFFVAFNTLSIWLTASLINNVLIDFDKLLEKQQQLLNKLEPSLNEKLKIAVNQLVLRETNIETLKVLCLSIICVFIFKNIFLYLKNLSTSYVQIRIVTNLRNRIYAHLHSLSLSFFHKRKFGDLTSVIMNDVGTLNQAIGATFQKIIVEPINIISFAILLFIISSKLMLVALLIIPLNQILVQFLGGSIRRKAKRDTLQIGGILSLVTETLSSIRIVKAFAMEKKEIAKFDKESWKYFDLLFRKAKLQLLSTPIIEIIGISMAVLLLWIGGSKVIVGSELSSEDFLRFMFLLFSMLGPIRSLSNVHIKLQNGYASAERIFEILDQDTEIKNIGQENITDLKSSIKFKKVDFSYDQGETFKLSDISFEIPKGCTYALVGESGSGKSTIADLLPRFYDVSNGSINIDNKNIKEYDLESIRKIMGIVTQETILLNISVRENIAYGENKIDNDLIIKSAIGANANDFIKKLDKGYDTIIGERGVKLSGGQRQRIAIARAIYKNPSILILDEATSALDSKSEKLVQEALDNLMADRTALVIAHRLSTIIKADKIIVLEDGKIKEVGNHKELYNKKGSYYDLHNTQFDN
ncbi:MAG: ABC transporter ATP-binding protein [Fidelibacterota bacterium]|jgi:subfamily B ATP-binding cassette protein MsbA|tara:strand:- start:2851 stop:4689 length:1839 start_codon:yes stop_codon:yes gene_type:complete